MAFQVQDICAQVCDDDIRKAIKDLPKDLPETYERSLNRIVNAGKVNVAKKVFRWVAAVQRPLSLEELREAIAIEPCQPFSNPERLVNDMNRLISWCGNLIILDEEEQVVQFAHHTVQQFFLSASSTPSLDNFHFQFSEINHEAGEVCVTYLNFNDFKKQVVRFSGARPSLEPKAILKASLSAGLNKNISRSWSRLGRLWGYKPTGNYNLLRQLQDGAGFKDLGSLRKLQTHYPFLAYASEFWLLHTADFVRESTRSWRLWSNLLNAENTLARTPWTFIEWTKRTGGILQWIVQYNHCALLRWITDSDTNALSLQQRKYILSNSAAKGRLELLDIILNSQGALKVGLDIALQAAAGGGHTEVVKKLLTVDADVNEPASRQGGRALQVTEEVGPLDMIGNLPAGGTIANTALVSKRDHSALEASAEDRQLEGAKKLLGVKANVDTPPTTYGGRTALQAAAEGGHLKVVEMLLTAGADVNAAPTESGGRTALQAAVAGGHVEVVDLLKGVGAQI